MRWIDIDLTPLVSGPQPSRLLAEAAQIERTLLQLQQAEGLDSPLVVARMADVGQLLFQAVTEIQPAAFHPEQVNDGAVDPPTGMAEADHVTGYHLRAPAQAVGLPWIWLHNGVGFLLQRHPICAATGPSRIPSEGPVTPWMKRYRAAARSEPMPSGGALHRLLERLRPLPCADPEILFVPGHCEEKIRRLMYREADGIGIALAAGAHGRPLARLSVLDEAVTPALLSRCAAIYQGLHFAGPTAQPLDRTALREEGWLRELLAWQETTQSNSEMAAAELDLELEVVGVDPITSLLDAVAERSANRGPDQAAPAGNACAARPRWWLDDGPVQPEELGRGGVIPPLVFSNSYRSLPELGARFLNSGASLFVGPLAPLLSHPARHFAGRFYDFLADGLCAGAALRAAALACRERYGPDHPVWLSYGIAGYGSLALQYL